MIPENKNYEKGSTMVEFSLVGIPMIFVMISAVQMALGMWQYETLAYAVKTGAQTVASKGSGCTTNGNSCGTTVGAIATAISNAAIGIPASQLNITLTTASGATTSCNPVNTCFSSSTAWPPTSNSDNQPGKSITVSGSFLLNAPAAMYYPGSKPVSFSSATLSASATQPLMF
jgi:Flp pilus assembly protein TadG